MPSIETSLFTSVKEMQRSSELSMEISEDFFDGSSPREQVLEKRAVDKFKFTNKILLDYLELRKGSGATIKQIADATGFSRDTVAKHLSYLVATRQAYQVNDDAGLYHKNGRIVHYRNMKTKAFDKKLYSFYYLQNLDGNKMVYLQEKEVGKLKMVTVKGGMMIEKKDLHRFIEELKAFESEISGINNEQ